MKNVTINNKEIKIFEVGDKVKVIDYKTTLGSEWIYYENVRGWYKPGCSEYFLKEMEKFCGMEATVLYVDEYYGVWLDVDKQKNSWNYQMLEMLEPTEEEETDAPTDTEDPQEVEAELEPEVIV